MAGQALKAGAPATRTNWVALLAIFVLTISEGIAGAGLYFENFYWLAFAGVVSLAGVGCAVLALGDS